MSTFIRSLSKISKIRAFALCSLIGMTSICGTAQASADCPFLRSENFSSATSLENSIWKSVQIQSVDPLTLIDWKMGDSADYQISALFGKLGTMHKEVTGEEGTGVWITQTMNLMGNSQNVQTLIDRNTGKVLKVLQNGKEVEVPTELPEIISQDYTEVTVPAGTFKTLHIVAKTKQVNHIEVWMNNKSVVMDGTVKEVIQAQFGDLTIELTEQSKN